jgi:hypothetical protein
MKYLSIADGAPHTLQDEGGLAHEDEGLVILLGGQPLSGSQSVVTVVLPKDGTTG